MLDSRAMMFAPGHRLGRYEIVAPIGAGGMGEVYEAVDPLLGRHVAVKILSGINDDASRRRLLQEARLASALAHANICTIHDAGESDNHAFIAMELVSGVMLSNRIPTTGLPIDSVVRYGAQIASALAHAHDRGIVHRDLKSANVVVNSEGHAKVLDFGIAQRIGGDVLTAVTRSVEPIEVGRLAGTLPYMAPEVLTRHAADARSDIWSLGVLLFEMATGGLPFTGQSSFELTSAILKDPVPSSQRPLPAGLVRVVMRCLAKDPGERYQSAGEVQAALEALSVETASNPRATAIPRGHERWKAMAVTVVFVVLTVFAWYGWQSVRTPVHRDSIAVLPFANASGDAAKEFYAEGITDALIAELGQVKTLRVTSRTSVMRMKGSTLPLPSIAEQLGVATVLEGSVLQIGTRLRVTAQLVDAATDRTLWSDSYDRDITEVLALQGDVARAIVTELRGQLTPQEESRFAQQKRVAPEVHETYLRGRYQLNRRNEESLRLAAGLFRRTLELDASYAPAHAGLADAYLLLGSQAIGALPAREALPVAKAAALRALAIDNDLAEAHTSLGRALSDDWKLAAGETAYRRALEINPNSSMTRFWLAISLASQQRNDEAIEQVQQAYRLDPVSPIIAAGVSFIYHFARRDDLVIDYARRSLELDPEFAIGRMRLGIAHSHQRNHHAAIGELEHAVKTSGGAPDMIGLLGFGYAAAGRTSDALQTIARLQELRRTRHVPAFNEALIYTWLGQHESAVEWLERAYEDRYQGLLYLRADPDMDPLRGTPRFDAVLKRVLSEATMPSPAADAGR